MTRKFHIFKQYRHLSRFVIIASVLSIAGMIASENAQANTFKSPDILMLGDSQLSFGTGLEMIRFFENFEARCEDHVGHNEVLNKISHMRTTLIGARSTTLRSWSTSKGGAYDKLCKKDPNWGVNASIWGHMRNEDRKYIQIGETENFDFCEPSLSPLEAMYQQGYKPKLLLINILGNGAVKWAGSPKGAELDLKGVLGQLPEDLPCVYIATMPTYTKKRNDRRFKAQNNLKKAMHKLGDRCTFVDTLDKSTIKAIQNKGKFFRKNEKGKVKDPFHPQQEAAELVLRIKEKQLCKAVVQAVLPAWEGQSFEMAEAEVKPVIEPEAEIVKASLTKKSKPEDQAGKANELEEVKVINKPEVKKMLQTVKVAKVTEAVETTVEIAEIADTADTADTAKITEQFHYPIPVLVRILPNGVTIEDHKMSELLYVTPTKPLDGKGHGEIVSVVEKNSVAQSTSQSSVAIRGSLDLYFTNGDVSSKLLQIKTKEH